MVLHNVGRCDAENHNNGNSALDFLNYSNKIGFKVKTSSGILNIEEEQDENNAKILKGDKVVIIKRFISNREFIDIKN